jgi:hypothetical protein
MTRGGITPPTPATLPNFLENRLIPCKFMCVGGVGGVHTGSTTMRPRQKAFQ